MASRDLARQLAELKKRVDRLEGRAAPAAAPTADDPHVTYSGTGPWRGGPVVWQIIRGWTDVLAETGDRSATLFSALASTPRLRIVLELMDGEVLTTADLARRLDQPSTGQLFHHLKELLAAGVIYQPGRGAYAIRREHAVPLLAMLCAAIDIRESTLTEAYDDHPHR
ncbi:ArsR/SmtB family transcription factor [Allorhizocola rhizosphaerae]|uniref:ArsR/SmtB family transcription factor n=1 Tax=Allorhizocola rhizosphaerae TaxID=1872709 RepID=UPI000E3DDECB|nr:helix-turn-helix domain-containing protein [Allorhizocola rhizosphaerae]